MEFRLCPGGRLAAKKQGPNPVQGTGAAGFIRSATIATTRASHEASDTVLDHGGVIADRLNVMQMRPRASSARRTRAESKNSGLESHSANITLPVPLAWAGSPRVRRRLRHHIRRGLSDLGAQTVTGRLPQAA
jgi:hypothetical protein